MMYKKRYVTPHVLFIRKFLFNCGVKSIIYQPFITDKWVFTLLIDIIVSFSWGGGGGRILHRLSSNSYKIYVVGGYTTYFKDCSYLKYINVCFLTHFSSMVQKVTYKKDNASTNIFIHKVLQMT